MTPLTLIRETGEVFTADAQCDRGHAHLSPMEFDVLDAIARREHGATHETIYDVLWGAKPDADQPLDPGNTVKVIVHRLREKLQPLGYKIIVHYARGYELRAIGDE